MNITMTKCKMCRIMKRIQEFLKWFHFNWNCDWSVHPLDRFISLIKTQELIGHLQANFDTKYFANPKNYNQPHNLTIMQREC